MTKDELLEEFNIFVSTYADTIAIAGTIAIRLAAESIELGTTDTKLDTIKLVSMVRDAREKILLYSGLKGIPVCSYTELREQADLIYQNFFVPEEDKPTSKGYEINKIGITEYEKELIKNFADSVKPRQKEES